MDKAFKIIALCICVLFISGCSYQKNLIYVRSKSQFSDFTVVNGKVRLVCSFEIRNTSDKDLKFNISADFNEDKLGGLLKESILYALDEKGGKEVFEISPKNTERFQVVFVGGFGGREIKKNRNPPDRVLFEVVM